MFPQKTITALLFGLTCSTGWSDNAGHIDVTAPPATALLAPVSAGRSLVSLPGLDYALDIDVNCGEQASPVSVSVSVNDTQRTLTGEALAQADEPVTLSVPEQQVSPVALENFCALDGDQLPVSAELLVEDIVTAHLSLRCATDDDEWIIYASSALDVTLTCQLPETDQPASEIDR